jgi:hypothetical protein
MEIPIKPIKPNKTFLKICHFFGFRLDEEHPDDITINLPTRYIDVEYFNYTEDIDSESSWIIEDIFEQIYKRFKKDPKLEKKCRNAKMVIATYYKDSSYSRSENRNLICLPYIDGELFNPHNEKLLKRELKLKELLG